MGYRLILLPEAEKQLRRLERSTAKRILKKLTWIMRQQDPLHHTKALKDSKIGDLRFRIGDYRAVAILDTKKNLILIAAIGHRRDIYQS